MTRDDMAHADDDGIIGTRNTKSKERFDDLALFAQPDVRDNEAATSGRAGVRAARGVRTDPVFGRATGPGAREFVKAALLPRVLEEARRSANAIPRGFTADDVRAIALELDLGTGEEREQRAWSWLGPWLGVLARRGQIGVLRDIGGRPLERKSVRGESHGNPQIIYTAADAARAVA